MRRDVKLGEPRMTYKRFAIVMMLGAVGTLAIGVASFWVCVERSRRVVLKGGSVVIHTPVAWGPITLTKIDWITRRALVRHPQLLPRVGARRFTTSNDRGPQYVAVIPLWPFVVVLAGLSWWFWRRGTVRPGHCRRCGYNLTGNRSGQCPECGAATDGATSGEDSTKKRPIG